MRIPETGWRAPGQEQHDNKAPADDERTPEQLARQRMEAARWAAAEAQA